MLPDKSLSRTRAAEARENTASIRAIPHDELPDEEARGVLIALALRGQDVYAYRLACSPTYVVWVRDPDPAVDSRWVPSEWAAHWRSQQQAGGAR
jgi:hypothetical protein